MADEKAKRTLVQGDQILIPEIGAVRHGSISRIGDVEIDNRCLEGRGFFFYLRFDGENWTITDREFDSMEEFIRLHLVLNLLCSGHIERTYGCADLIELKDLSRELL